MPARPLRTAQRWQVMVKIISGRLVIAATHLANVPVL